MRTRIWASIAGAGVAVALAVAAIAAPVASAAGHIIHMGRGGVFFVTNPGPVSTATIIGGIAVSVAVVAGVAYLALALDRRRTTRLSAVPDAGESAGTRDAVADEHERKAA
jgi:hypothetical protein